MTVPVVWFSLHPDEHPPAGYWDQGLVAALFNHQVATPPGWPHQFVHFEGDALPDEGCVVIICASHHEADVDQLNAALAPLPWVVVILTNNEEGRFPAWRLDHPNMRLWIQSPHPDQAPKGHTRFLPFGWPGDCPALVRNYADEANARPFDWAFLGQDTHARRHEAIAAVHDRPGGMLVTTDRFGAGAPYAQYLAALASAKTVLCPSGPVAVDSFRVWEALEAGAVPLVDTRTPEGTLLGFWPIMLDEQPPFPLVDDWATAPGVITAVVADWPHINNRLGGWWKRYKRRIACRIADDIADLSGGSPSGWPTSLREHITVIVPTSPIPGHPSLGVLEATLASVWAHPELAGCEVLLAIDGIRAEQLDRRDAYEEYVRRIVWACHHRRGWENVVPVIAEEHEHQANTTRDALGYVRTPLVLFVEHDTPLVGEVPWCDLAEVVLAGDANAVRLHYDASIHPDHEHLMEGDAEPVGVPCVPLIPTRQWSQRPHLAHADWYRRTLERHFPPSGRTMIEDLLHGLVQEDPWDSWRVWIYAPAGDMKRSTHLDGRGDDPKYEMRFR